MTYDELLAGAPEHDSEAFLQYLRDNNTVVFEGPNWLIIENFKYHSAERPWLTVFWKHTQQMKNSLQFSVGLMNVLEQYPDWTWLKKTAEDQSVKRFHIHIHK